MTEWLQDYAYRVKILAGGYLLLPVLVALIIAVATISIQVLGRCYEPGKEFENGIKWRMPDA